MSALHQRDVRCRVVGYPLCVIAAYLSPDRVSSFLINSPAPSSSSPSSSPPRNTVLRKRHDAAGRQRGSRCGPSYLTIATIIAIARDPCLHGDPRRHPFPRSPSGSHRGPPCCSYSPSPSRIAPRPDPSSRSTPADMSVSGRPTATDTHRPGHHPRQLGRRPQPLVFLHLDEVLRIQVIRHRRIRNLAAGTRSDNLLRLATPRYDATGRITGHTTGGRSLATHRWFRHPAPRPRAGRMPIPCSPTPSPADVGHQLRGRRRRDDARRPGSVRLRHPRGGIVSCAGRAVRGARPCGICSTCAQVCGSAGPTTTRRADVCLMGTRPSGAPG